MNLTVEQIAELLAGIARSQQTIIDAIEMQTAGFRSTYLLSKLNVAANTRLPNARLIDLPSRILLRSQSRVPMDTATIARDLLAALAGTGAATAAAPTSAAAPAGTPASDDLNFDKA